MSAFKTHKRISKTFTKDKVGDTFHHSKLVSNKLKYKHKSYWIEEEMAEIVPFRMKKKKKLA